MDTLKKIFPFSFGIADVTKLVINIVIYVIIGAIAVVIIGFVPVVGAILGGLIEAYVVIGVLLAVLDYLKLIK